MSAKEYKPYKPLVEKTCAYCESVFHTRMDKKRFCNERCRLDFQKKMYRGICPHCGGVLFPGHDQ